MSQIIKETWDAINPDRWIYTGNPDFSRVAGFMAAEAAEVAAFGQLKLDEPLKILYKGPLRIIETVRCVLPSLPVATNRLCLNDNYSALKDFSTQSVNVGFGADLTGQVYFLEVLGFDGVGAFDDYKELAIPLETSKDFVIETKLYRDRFEVYIDGVLEASRVWQVDLTQIEYIDVGVQRHVASGDEGLLGETQIISVDRISVPSSVKNLSEGDVRLSFEESLGGIVVDGNDVQRDKGLETAILISLFTDMRATLEDEYPKEINELRGWWGDQFQEKALGSHIWLLSRSKIETSTMDQLRQYSLNALQWMLDDGVAEEIEVTVERGDEPDELLWTVRVKRPVGVEDADFKFYLNWEAQKLRGVG